MTSRNASARSFVGPQSTQPSTVQSSNFTSTSTFRTTDDDYSSRSGSYTSDSRSSKSYTPSSTSGTSSLATISEVFSNQKQYDNSYSVSKSTASYSTNSSDRSSSSWSSSSSRTYTRSPSRLPSSNKRHNKSAQPSSSKFEKNNTRQNLSKLNVAGRNQASTSRVTIQSPSRSPSVQQIIESNRKLVSNNRIVQAHRISIPFVPDSQVVPIDLALRNLTEILSRSETRAAASNNRPSGEPQNSTNARQPSRLPSRQPSRAVGMDRLAFGSEQQSSQNAPGQSKIIRTSRRHGSSRIGLPNQPSLASRNQQPSTIQRQPPNRSFTGHMRCAHCGAMIALNEPHSCLATGQKTNAGAKAIDGRSQSTNRKFPSNTRNNAQQPSSTAAASMMPQFSRLTAKNSNSVIGRQSSSDKAQNSVPHGSKFTVNYRHRTENGGDQYDTEEYDEELTTTDKGYRKHGIVRRINTRPCRYDGGGDNFCCRKRTSFGDACNFRQRKQQTPSLSPQRKRCDVFYNCAATNSSQILPCNENHEVQHNVLSSFSSTSLLGGRWYPSVIGLCSRIKSHLKQASSLIGHYNNDDGEFSQQQQRSMCTNCKAKFKEKTFCKLPTIRCCPAFTARSNLQQQKSCRGHGSGVIRILIIVIGFAFLVFIVYDWLFGNNALISASSNIKSNKLSNNGALRSNWNWGFNDVLPRLSSRSFVTDAASRFGISRDWCGGGLTPGSLTNSACEQNRLVPSLFTYSRSAFQGLIK